MLPLEPHVRVLLPRSRQGLVHVQTAHDRVHAALRDPVVRLEGPHDLPRSSPRRTASRRPPGRRPPGPSRACDPASVPSSGPSAPCPPRPIGSSGAPSTEAADVRDRCPRSSSPPRSAGRPTSSASAAVPRRGTTGASEDTSGAVLNPFRNSLCSTARSGLPKVSSSLTFPSRAAITASTLAGTRTADDGHHRRVFAELPSNDASLTRAPVCGRDDEGLPPSEGFDCVCVR